MKLMVRQLVYAAISVYLINQANTEAELVNLWDESTRYLASLARVQSVDLHHYHTTDFENFKETAALYEQFLIAVAAHFPPLKDPSVQEALFKYLPEQDDEIHTIMKDACKATHTALQSDDIISNALKSQVAVSRAMTLTLGQSAEAVLYVTSVRLKAQAKKLLELERERATTKAATPSPDSEAYQELGVFYKSDGTPRSKLKGIGFFSVGLMAYLLFEAVAAIDELDNAVNNLSTLVNIQRVDHHCFATTDLNNFEQTLALYKQFYNSVLFTVGEESAAVTEAFEQLDEFEETDAHLHSILKKACEDVHATLQDNSGSTSQIVIAQKIIIILDQSLAEVFAKLNARLVSSISEMQQERAAKDARGEGVSTASEDYEVVG
ncbi:hypothetical protein ONZ45_g16651 [Pleurotus djamor]|nr:hypothetical protein ONZ45_g16651 [Pleurotus djamor]